MRARWQGAGRVSVRIDAIERRAERMLAALDLGGAELSILLCDDACMRGLNARHRGLPRTTDVLSFAALDASRLGGGRVLGDVVISLPTARRQARAAGCPVSDRVTELLAHGVLHLLGHDHRNQAELRRMRARTDLLCAAAGGGRKRRHK